MRLSGSIQPHLIVLVPMSNTKKIFFGDRLSGILKAVLENQFSQIKPRFGKPFKIGDHFEGCRATGTPKHHLTAANAK
jgi:hypothetical protein